MTMENERRLEENLGVFNDNTMIGNSNNNNNNLKHADMQKSFNNFQRSYLMVYVTVMGADWLQAPYLYLLYKAYGLTLEQTSLLFLTGLLSGVFIGPILGNLADLWGRRKLCLLFCVMTITALILRMINVLPVLVLSQVFSGTSTTLIHGAFESWYVTEHALRGYPADWRPQTFATCTFLNGLVAIIGVLIANQLVGFWGLRAPYIFSMVLIGINGVIIFFTWSENYGKTQGKNNIKALAALKHGYQILFSNSNILLLGAAQIFFECSMYIFVLVYTPTIEGYNEDYKLPLGYLFFVMVFAVMCGSLTFQIIVRQASIPRPHHASRALSKDRLLVLALAIACASFFCMAYGIESIVALGLAYLLFEFATGLYYPSISSLKAEQIPDESRTTIMALLRVPVDLLIVIIFWNVNAVSSSLVFALCGIMTFLGAILVAGRYKK